MEQKINIAELLKDCPSGMELDCTLYDNCTFEGIEDIGYINILVKTPNGQIKLSKEGCIIHNCNSAKCVIFPKGKTTWEGFKPPCKFKDGDILVHTQNQRLVTSIYRNRVTEFIIGTHCILWDKNEGLTVNVQICCYPDNTRFATEEEKAKLFQAIKENGYKWNAETKILEKLIEPKFKVGDRVKDKNNFVYTILSVERWGYMLNDLHRTCIGLDKQDNYELFLDKFDITTLKPFDEVLVRQGANGKWGIDFFGSYTEGFYYATGSSMYIQCIPYKGNEHLLGTTDDCDEYFKTWE